MDVSTRTDAALAIARDYPLIDALLGGTPAMRAAGEVYLPRRPLEDAADYAARLARATLLPAFAETIDTMGGRAFADPVLVNDDVPGWISDEVLPDVDRQGRNLHVWAREWFDEALAYGLSHVLVESPAATGVRTLRDQREAGLRPYLVRVHPRDVLGWRASGGRLTQVRIGFTREEDDGEFGTRAFEEVRVYEPGRVRVYVNDRDDWVLSEEIATTLDRVPLVTLYTKRTGLMTATPPLRELAYLNAKHWAMQSSIDTLVDTASVPILALTGVDSGDDVVIGAKHALRLPHGADAKYVEHSGAAIEAGQAALAALVEDMRHAGSRLLTRDARTKTATQAGEDAARENSALGAMVQQLEDTLHDVLDLVAEYRGESTGGTVAMQPNLDPDPTPAETMGVLLNMRNAGALSDPTLLAEAKRRNLVADDVEWEEEQERIAAQGM